MLLRTCFLDADYEQFLFEQYQTCRQGYRMVRDYATEFYHLSAINVLTETESQQVSRFNVGLCTTIFARIEFYSIFTLRDAIRMTRKAERQLELLKGKKMLL